MSDREKGTDGKGISFFERYLTVRVMLCIVAGMVLGKLVPEFAKSLDAMANGSMSLPQ